MFYMLNIIANTKGDLRFTYVKKHRIHTSIPDNYVTTGHCVN